MNNLDNDALDEAVIAVMNGMKLMHAHNLYGKRIKTEGSSTGMATYGKIRNGVMNFCKTRNPEEFEKLRENDVIRNSKAKAGSKKEANDVCYETLQFNRHKFITLKEARDFKSHLEVMVNTPASELLEKQVKIEKRIAKMASVVHAMKVVEKSNIAMIGQLVSQSAGVRNEIEKRIAEDKKSYIFIESINRIGAVERVVDFSIKKERRKKNKQVNKSSRKNIRAPASAR